MNPFPFVNPIQRLQDATVKDYSFPLNENANDTKNIHQLFQ
jgi:hypothetical protein